MFALMLSLTLAATADVDGDEYRWIATAEDPTRLYLYRGDEQQGGYDLEGHWYRLFDGTAWGAPCEPPLPPPCFGVVRDRPADVEEHRYLLNGAPVDAREARDAVEKGIVDDRRKLRVTVIGPDAARTKVRREIETHPEFTALRDVMSIRDYSPDHWAVSVGFVTYDPRLDPDLRSWLRSIFPIADVLRPLSLVAAAGLGILFAKFAVKTA
jgi:hypothetical protein